MDPRADTKLPECDLVMKGGITSGIVYPPALFELHKHYRFNSIGGTSAGAVAAAGAAAAEYGRDKIVLDENGQETDGFTRFTNAADDLNKQILKLFNADQSTQAIGSLAKAIGVFGSDGKPPTLWERVSRAWESLRKFDTPWFWTGAAIAAIIGALIGGGLWALGNLFGLWEI